MAIDRQRELAVQLRLMRSLERRFTARYAALFNRYAKNARQGYLTGGRRGVLLAVSDFAKDLRPILTANILEAANLFGRRVLEAFEGARKEAPSKFELSIQGYLAKYALAKVTSVTDTTTEDVLRAIVAGETAGDPIPVIARAISDATGGAVARHRASTIAITETHSAATYASQEAARFTGLALEKEWVSAEDGRTRPSHVAADGQRVAMDEAFSVGGYELQFPGDPAGPAAETIRCRCIEVYHEASI